MHRHCPNGGAWRCGARRPLGYAVQSRGYRNGSGRVGAASRAWLGGVGLQAPRIRWRHMEDDPRGTNSRSTRREPTPSDCQLAAGPESDPETVMVRVPPRGGARPRHRPRGRNAPFSDRELSMEDLGEEANRKRGDMRKADDEEYDEDDETDLTSSPAASAAARVKGLRERGYGLRESGGRLNGGKRTPFRQWHVAALLFNRIANHTRFESASSGALSDRRDDPPVRGADRVRELAHCKQKHKAQVFHGSSGELRRRR
jgi:hypothetical protein